MLATLAPFADELAVYPGSDLRPQDGEVRALLRDPDGDARGCGSSAATRTPSERDPWDYPLSSRFDEMDAVAIFDDVVVPWDRVFLDGDPELYSTVITDSHWRAHIVHQAMTRAWAKLEFAFGLGHALADMTGVNAFDHVQEKLGELWSMMEMTRAGVIAAEAGSYRPRARTTGCRTSGPSSRCAADAEVDAARAGAAPARRRRRLHGDPVEGRLGRAAARRHREVLPGAQRRTPSARSARSGSPGTSSAQRSAAARELYERFYLQDSFRMTALAYKLADKEHPLELVERFLRDDGGQHDGA